MWGCCEQGCPRGDLDVLALLLGGTVEALDCPVEPKDRLLLVLTAPATLLGVALDFGGTANKHNMVSN